MADGRGCPVIAATFGNKLIRYAQHERARNPADNTPEHMFSSVGSAVCTRTVILISLAAATRGGHRYEPTFSQGKQMHAQTRQPLPNIDDVSPLDAADQACMSDLRRVLETHGKLQRFGLTLLHDHFSIGGDEVLLEECDVDSRTLTIRPVKEAALENAQVIETNWRLDTMESLAACQQVCIACSDGKGGMTHAGHHNRG